MSLTQKFSGGGNKGAQLYEREFGSKNMDTTFPFNINWDPPLSPKDPLFGTTP